MKTILYCRVSTSDQTLDHQVTQAHAAGLLATIEVSAASLQSSFQLCCGPNSRQVSAFSTSQLGPALRLKPRARL